MNSETLEEMSSVFALKLQSFSDDSSDWSHSWFDWPWLGSDFHWWSEWTDSERVDCEGIHSECHWSSCCTEKGGADRGNMFWEGAQEVWIKRHWHGSGMTMQCKFEKIEVQFHFCIDIAVKRNESIQNKRWSEFKRKWFSTAKKCRHSTNALASADLHAHLDSTQIHATWVKQLTLRQSSKGRGNGVKQWLSSCNEMQAKQAQWSVNGIVTFLYQGRRTQCGCW